MAQYRLHCFCQSGNSYKVALYLACAQLDWEPVFVDFMHGATRDPNWRQSVNEMGEAPVLETAGAKLFRGSYADQAAAFKDRKVDGVFAILALPATAVTVATEGRALTLLPCSESLLRHLATFGLGKGQIPAGTYPKAVNGGENVISAIMGTTIIVSTAMSDDMAYTITKTINDNADRFRGLHASLADYDPSKGWLSLGVALHPGAERYYREKGWLR